ncbi:MAG: YeeE/YedE thiosulfate transporter family protein [Desulfomonilaceae bacterium]|nr:YeeE/YedE thiosulfate transporter family protein [Desulfomonilaceae bacterium]
MQAPDYAQGFWNPYVAGVALGLVLLMSFYLMGTGLGASGAVVRTAAVVAHSVAPEAVEQNEFFKSLFKSGGKHPLMNRIVFMVLGIFLGGFVAVLTARRFRPEVGRGPTAGVGLRLSLAFVGGVLGGVGTRFALGCTSGQALSGGATMAAGSWAFMLAVFGTAFAAAYFVRRQWS